ncbi:histone acetyltransferase [Elasticomyces elasticus]|nr:histone acetyltransferase [Elasticomyces elasticus]KAK3655369.1 histone acetyltransferase [Elasticomyces elasticus]KAK4922103.1 histone acetyltransferase [Elasticomyces elasticus]KAK5750962.1 histone acetyltransferase [Elasticomyces elasticus]
MAPHNSSPASTAQCAPCFSRYYKLCDGQHPCGTCVRTGRDCEYGDEAMEAARLARVERCAVLNTRRGPWRKKAAVRENNNEAGDDNDNDDEGELDREESSKRKASDAETNGGSPTKRIKTSATPSPPPFPPPTHALAALDKPAVLEERNGEITFQVVNNDNTPRSMIILTGLKCIFQKQLPKMPKDYIARLVYDRTHLSIAIVKKPPEGSHAEASGLPGEVVGGITYRPFVARKFAEIVFCAISSDQQVKGYGAHLMNHLKDYVRATSPVRYFLTYADNYAIGYFKKQGFTKEISLSRPKWMGYIKDYEGGTIMQCSMLPKVRYLESARMLLKQKATVHAKIRAVSRSYEVHRPPLAWRDAKPGEKLVELEAKSFDAVRATGWSEDMDVLARQPRRNPSHSLLLHLLSALQTSSSAWPFLQPVNGDEVQDYYSVILEPMDLSTMEGKLDKDLYEGVEDFVRDVLLLVRNCKRYNAESTPYAKAANKLEKEMWRKVREVPEWSYLESEGFESTNRAGE